MLTNGIPGLAILLEVERMGPEETKNAWRKAMKAPGRRNRQNWILKEEGEYPCA